VAFQSQCLCHGNEFKRPKWETNAALRKIDGTAELMAERWDGVPEAAPELKTSAAIDAARGQESSWPRFVGGGCRGQRLQVNDPEQDR